MELLTKKKHKKEQVRALPAALQKEAEKASGISMKQVSIHYNSELPEQHQAHALTFGNDIYIHDLSQRHLHHELGHVLQQHALSIPATSYENGMAVNSSSFYENSADLWHTKAPSAFLPSSFMIQNKRTPSHPIIQKEAVGVTLSIPGIYSSNDVIVDTISLDGRFKTGLENNAEGNHTVADILIKKAQKYEIMEKPVRHALQYYRILAQSLLQSAVPFGVDPNDKTATKRRNSTISEAMNSISYTNFIDQSLSISQWSIVLMKAIKSYNQAYATSASSTTPGKPNGGHGEASIVNDLKKDNFDATKIAQLIDYASVDNLSETMNVPDTLDEFKSHEDILYVTTLVNEQLISYFVNQYPNIPLSTIQTQHQTELSTLNGNSNADRQRRLKLNKELNMLRMLHALPGQDVSPIEYYLTLKTISSADSVTRGIDAHENRRSRKKDLQNTTGMIQIALNLKKMQNCIFSMLDNLENLYSFLHTEDIESCLDCLYHDFETEFIITNEDSVSPENILEAIVVFSNEKLHELAAQYMPNEHEAQALAIQSINNLMQFLSNPSQISFDTLPLAMMECYQTITSLHEELQHALL